MNALLLLALALPAHAYELWGTAWSPDDMPLYYLMSDYTEDSFSNITDWQIDTNADGTPDYTFSSAYAYQEWITEKSFENWYISPCADFEVIYSDWPYGDLGNAGSSEDGYNVVYWDDPRRDQQTGVLGVTERNTDWEFLGWVYGTAVYRFTDVDITFNDNIDWASQEEILAGCSGGMQAYEPVATHEIGHFLGLGHTCEEGEPCNDTSDREATMYWSTTNCSLDQASPREDNDGQGVLALYGPNATFEALQLPVGKVPFQVDFETTSDVLEEITAVDWNFGDGTRVTELNPSHVYEEPGQYTVSVDITGYSDECGEWQYNYNKYGYVTACDPPTVAMSPEGEPYPGLFTYTVLGDLELQMVNRTDASVYGCVDTISWEVYQGDTLVMDPMEAWSPRILFPAAGTYRVLLNVGGPGGVVAEELTVEVGATGGCSTVPLGVGAMGVLAGLGLALGRRRRS